MHSQFIACVFAVVVVFGPSAAVCSAQEKSKFVGVWKGKIDTHDEIWTVKSTDGKLSVNGKLRKNGMETGSFIGTDVKETDGTLTFTRKFVKKPTGEWSDEAKIVVKSEGENLSYAWTAGQLKGTRAMEKYEEGDKAPADDDLGKFRGSWTADVATGFHVVMQITMKKDKIEVTANYYNKKNQLVGNFTGADPVIKDGFLTFSQKFGTKPVNGWMDGKKHTLQMVGDDTLKFSWEKGGTESFARVKK